MEEKRGGGYEETRRRKLEIQSSTTRGVAPTCEGSHNPLRIVTAKKKTKKNKKKISLHFQSLPLRSVDWIQIYFEF